MSETGELTLHPVAWYQGDLKEKFGLPRQSGLVPQLAGKIIMAEGFRRPEALPGAGRLFHLWLLWGFSKNHTWSPTVRPPRWAAIPGWGSLPPGRLFGPTR